MNVKIKVTGVYCPFEDNYEKYYLVIKRHLVSEDEQMFTERVAGHGYLQWELPDDGWRSLTDADPLLEQEIRAEYRRRQQLVLNRFGDNQDMALKVLAVPDDSYVYYKIDAQNRIDIKLTAWGYLYPERIETDPIVADNGPVVVKEQVSIRFVYADKPMPKKDFVLNRILPKQTNADGVYEIGELPVGYQFDVEVDGRHRHITVLEGNGDICIDLTEYVDVQVSVQKDGAPFDGAKVTVSYMGRQMEPVCSGGVATVRMPLSLGNDMCVVTADDRSLQRPLAGGIERFVFQFESPAPVPVPGQGPVADRGQGPVADRGQVQGRVQDSDSDSVPEPDPKQKKWYEDSKWGCLFTGLLALLIAALLYCTLIICMGLLNG